MVAKPARPWPKLVSNSTSSEETFKPVRYENQIKLLKRFNPEYQEKQILSADLVFGGHFRFWVLKGVRRYRTSNHNGQSTRP
ncbi:hypothetical protein [Leptospira alexanderi]|uniref:hypothetical protein n=1 Tax=Leptospira alexanderi TaxID=100053 RepID=UPI000990F152|nr:hypothetical protein [Leptospira alexanderi]